MARVGLLEGFSVVARLPPGSPWADALRGTPNLALIELPDPQYVWTEDVTEIAVDGTFRMTARVGDRGLLRRSIFVERGPPLSAKQRHTSRAATCCSARCLAVNPTRWWAGTARRCRGRCSSATATRRTTIALLSLNRITGRCLSLVCPTSLISRRPLLAGRLH
jgi:hypothetical protein